MDWIVEIDRAITIAINGFNSPFFDQFFFNFSKRFVWVPLYLSLMFILFRKEGLRWYVPLIIVALMILVNDQVSSSFFKPLVARLRPTHDPSLEGIIHLVNEYRASGFSFLSSHASNTAALTVLMGLLYRNKSLFFSLLSWCLLTAYSRVYLGVHFFGDVLAGLALGALIAALFYYLFKRYLPTNTLPSRTPTQWVILTYLLSVVSIAGYALYFILQ